MGLGWRKLQLALRYGTRAVYLLAPFVAAMVAGLRIQHHQEVDVNSGRFRQRTVLCGIIVRERVRESWVSSTLGAALGPAHWRPMHSATFGMRVCFEDYRLGSAPHVARLLQAADEVALFNKVRRKAIARRVLLYWKADNARGAEEYAVDLLRRAVDRHAFGRAGALDETFLPVMP